jgi:5-methylcytosine-specific restriction endonuclease McrA
MERALVLNASYEPLSVVSGRRAIVLVLAEKADLVQATGHELHSERLVVALPSVIRLRYYVRVPYRRGVALSRRGVFARDGHRCQYCGRQAESLDHIVPRSRGGSHTWDNVVACCRPCNTQKRDRLLEQTSMNLRRRPRPPRQVTWVAAHVGHVPDAWLEFLDENADAAEAIPA